ncbi:hypothetical protein [Picosynechococcus sp. NKBG042902]|uniref:hypothetical protein n=1 Tax=Picosynechococcus sp. NKBG042902 TaxID=490193 RepID=UPI0004AAA4D0|nr:hypothetical protein [Picosynechococcus sp. NKBG042902]
MMQPKQLILGVATLGLLAIATLPASANRRHHLDVHRYCKRIFAQGNVWNGRQYTRDGWHRYNRRRNTHECGFTYRNLGETETGGEIGGGFGIFNIGIGASGNRSTTNTNVGREQTTYEAVWIDKACREQNSNPRAWAEQQGSVVWCVLP